MTLYATKGWCLHTLKTWFVLAPVSSGVSSYPSYPLYRMRFAIVFLLIFRPLAVFLAEIPSGSLSCRSWPRADPWQPDDFHARGISIKVKDTLACQHHECVLKHLNTSKMCFKKGTLKVLTVANTSNSS